MITKDEFKVGKNNIGYVSSSFESEFGNDELREGYSLKFKILPRDMKDSEIINELNIEECTLGDVLETLKNATSDMKDGKWNIFYIKGHSRVVFVYWGGRGWDVFDWDRGFGSWFGGSRVFSPATGAEVLRAGSSESLKLDPKDICECERCGQCGKVIKKWKENK